MDKIYVLKLIDGDPYDYREELVSLHRSLAGAQSAGDKAGGKEFFWEQHVAPNGFTWWRSSATDLVIEERDLLD